MLDPERSVAPRARMGQVVRLFPAACGEQPPPPPVHRMPARAIAGPSWSLLVGAAVLAGMAFTVALAGVVQAIAAPWWRRP